MIQFAVLGSGSSGNSAVVCHGDTKVLVDAGLSAKQLCVRLEQVGVDPDSLTAIVLTHEHGDHVQGLEVFLRKRAIPVYGTVHTCHIVQQDRIKKSEISWRKFEAGTNFKIGDFSIDTFNVPHDAVDPVGFVFQSPSGGRLGVLSDVGKVTNLIIDNLKGVDSLFVESNYDDVMLQEDEKRPWSLKQRISNPHGHLSNKQTAQLLKDVCSENLNQVVLGHLSSDCNTEDLALQFAREALSDIGLNDVNVMCAERRDPTPMLAAIKGAEIFIDPVAVDAVEVTPAMEETITQAAASIESKLEESVTAPILAEAKKVSSRPKDIRFIDEDDCEPDAQANLVQMELAL